jgi:hypothetical protein
LSQQECAHAGVSRALLWTCSDWWYSRIRPNTGSRAIILAVILLQRAAGAFFALIDTRDAPGAMIRAVGTLSAVALGSGAFVGVIFAFSAPRAACHCVSSVLAVERAGRTALTRCCPGVGFVCACLASCTRAPVGSCVACVAFAVFP